MSVCFCKTHTKIKILHVTVSMSIANHGTKNLLKTARELNNPNFSRGRGWGEGKCKKLSPQGGREDGEKSACSAQQGLGLLSRDLPCARRGSPAALHGHRLDK